MRCHCCQKPIEGPHLRARLIAPVPTAEVVVCSVRCAEDEGAEMRSLRSWIMEWLYVGRIAA